MNTWPLDNIKSSGLSRVHNETCTIGLVNGATLDRWTSFHQTIIACVSVLEEEFSNV